MVSYDKRNALLGFFVASCLTPCADAAELSQRKAESYADDAPPRAWFVLPEYADASAVADHNEAQGEQAKPKFGKALDALLTAQGSAFDHLIDASRWHPDAEARPAWILDEIAGDLALTAEGKIGILAIGGQIMVRTHWLRRSGGAAPTRADRLGLDAERSPDDEPDELAEASFDSTMSDEQLHAKLTMMVDALAAAGKVQNRQRALHGLRQVVEEVRTLMTYTPVAAHARWRPTVFRFEVSIDINGQVLPYLSFGGDVRLQLDWKLPTVPTSVPPSPWRAPVASQAGSTSYNFASLVTAINSDIELALARNRQTPRRFKAENFQIMVGMTLSGQVGVARGAIGLSGALTFAPVTTWQGQEAVIGAVDELLQPSRPGAYATLPLISDSLPNQEEDDYRRSAHIAAQPLSLAANGGRRGMLYHVSRQRFRRGIALTQDIGAFFAEHAAKIKHRHWFLKQFRFDFDMSIGGSLGLATLLGRLGARITYADPFTRGQGRKL